MNLMEAYKNRLSISEAVHQKTHMGQKLSAQKKLMIASVLNNTSKFLNEAFTSGDATQRSALGDYKKFCLNVSTISLPNLILPELMLTQPMTSISGYITYLKFTSGAQKGDLKADTLFNDAYSLGKMDEARIKYTSDKIVEAVTAGETFTPAWTPVVEGTVKFFNAAGAEVPATGDKVPAGAVKVRYEYDNVTVPQASIPTLKAAMTSVDLHAHARRIAVYYSQIAAFQAKTDYGYDLNEMLSNQAQGELAYEIDSEGVKMLSDGAEDVDTLGFKSYELFYNNSATTISRSQYYEQFNEIIARAKQVIYKRTQKFAPNYMVVGSNVLTIMPYVKGWTAAPAATVNGPYFAGTVDGLKVYCSPAIDENRFFFGVNGSDLQTAAGVYAPYMAVVPTQLLGFADGNMSQGFSTLYDMKLLNTYTGKIADGSDKAPANGETGNHSYLLAAGKFVIA